MRAGPTGRVRLASRDQARAVSCDRDDLASRVVRQDKAPFEQLVENLTRRGGRDGQVIGQVLHFGGSALREHDEGPAYALGDHSQEVRTAHAVSGYGGKPVSSEHRLQCFLMVFADATQQEWAGATVSQQQLGYDLIGARQVEQSNATEVDHGYLLAVVFGEQLLHTTPHGVARWPSDQIAVPAGHGLLENAS